MLAGDYKGEKAGDAKKKIQQDLIASGQACKYVEPENKIISRSGEECVVALCDQWLVLCPINEYTKVLCRYLNYGDPKWKNATKECLAKMNTYCEEVRRMFEYTVDWLHEYACSRSYGLGSKLSWDPQYLIESLSDSTIYNAFYPVAHFLQSDFYGQCQGSLGISAQQLSDDVWDYIFLGAE